MKKPEKIFKKMKHKITFICVVCITIIGGYGILQAPEKRANAGQLQLEQELARNEAALEKQNAELTFLGGQTEQNQSSLITQRKPAKNKSRDSQHNCGQTDTQKITAIGDSVLLGASPSVKKCFSKIIIDAKISRQVYQAQEITKNLKNKGQLWDTVIIALGTNGNFNPKTGQQLIDSLGKKRKIYWINAYGKSISWQKTVNQTIQQLAEKNENVTIIDWAKEAPSHQDWFYGDGIHLNARGQKGYAKFLKKCIK